MQRLPTQVALIGILCLACLATASARDAYRDPTNLIREHRSAVADSVSLSDLPVEGQKTYRLILAGGPFQYEKDGVVFGNRERLLPRQARGYYREYTVRTPGAHDRGAKRIVCGGWTPSQPEACYYSNDHYANFRQIVNSK